jgi:hypothetical protein
MSQSAMMLIAERHTPRFFKLNQYKCLKVIPERPIPQLREWRSEALRDNTDLNMGRSAIQFLTPDAPWSNNAPWRVVKPLKYVFCFLKGRGPLKKFFKSAEMLTN